MQEFPSTSGETEAVVLIKAAPQVGHTHGETVCCAGMDFYGNWLRLYPVSFRLLQEPQKFRRWDKIRFRWRRPKDDRRPESRRVDQDSIEIIGQLREKERDSFLAKSVVTSLEAERTAGRSLALIRPEFIKFTYDRKLQNDLDHEAARFERLRNQGDMFTKATTPHRPCPYRFQYHYRIIDGERTGTCQDWEVEATFFRWSLKYGEEKTLRLMASRFGEEYPRRGFVLAMGTHSQYPDRWLINGVLRLDDTPQQALL